MKIAIAVWGDRVATVFDAAERLLIVESKGGLSSEPARLPVSGVSIIAKAAAVKTSGVDVLICGAMPRPVEYMIETAGIQVVPFIRGAVADVLAAFLNGKLDDHVFVMPGCRRRAAEGQGGICRRRMQTNTGGMKKNENSNTVKRTGTVKSI